MFLSATQINEIHIKSESAEAEMTSVKVEGTET